MNNIRAEVLLTLSSNWLKVSPCDYIAGLGQFTALACLNNGIDLGK